MSAETTEPVPPISDEFDPFYRQRIEPDLMHMEERRKKGVLVIIAFWTLAGLGIAVFVLGGLYAQSFGLNKGTMMIGGFAAVAAGIIGQMLVGKRIRGSLKEVLVGRTCRFLGLDYALKVDNFPIDRFTGAGLISPEYDKTAFEDHIFGEHDGVRFELCEAHLELQKRRHTSHDDDRSKDTTVFRGLVLVYSFNKPFTGQTRVLPDFTWLGNTLAAIAFEPDRPGERVVLEDPRFEGKFEVYSTDQVEARYLLTPLFMERLMQLTSHFGDLRNVSLAFSGSDLLISVRTTDNRFEGGSLFETFVKRERAEDLIKELRLVVEIIDILNLADSSRA